MHINQIAKAFSLGEFDTVFKYFSEHIVWDIVGEQRFVGIQDVTKHCFQIQKYFNTTQHDFKIFNEFQCDHRCVVQGLATFSSNDSMTQIQACDVYSFDSEQMLNKIESYCIQIKN